MLQLYQSSSSETRIKNCVSTIKHLEEISSTLVPNEVCFISQYDKARVPIGLTAANKQSPLLMHVEYRVSLPDHDWVVAAQHKLIPFVYGGIVVQPNGLGKPEAVSYSGANIHCNSVWKALLIYCLCTCTWL